MKITKSYLKQVIKEELQHLNEGMKSSSLADIAFEIGKLLEMPPEDVAGHSQAIAGELESNGYQRTAQLVRAGKYKTALARLNKQLYGR